MTAQASAPDPDEVGQGINALEHYLAAQQPTQQPAQRPEQRPEEPAGQTRRVRRLAGEVAEAHHLAELQDDDTPLLLESGKVRKRRRKAHEAARLHQLGQDPVMRAWQAARMRRLLVTAGMVALTLALAWSTAGVQGFAAGEAKDWSPAWVFAWLVEPFLSLALLTVVGAKAYLGTRGQPVKSAKLDRIEYGFLGLTLTMNAWPYLPGVADTFELSRLVLHILGPIVAVAVVTALPIILEAFARLDHRPAGAAGVTGPLTGPSYSANTGADRPAGNPSGGGSGNGAGNGVDRVDVAALTDRARSLIASGDLPVAPSANALRQALRCGMDTARHVRDELRRPGQ
ncbi:conjugal transfer protein TraI [Actinomadura sp. KC216]|uniref:conjugal transfer protein TraI n=1 Tax=Actinomadura sp. KC216 TaxID=2530370 RepID=UPI001045D2D2|nr:conjugal transfer protein TraI [Actinomadura sp. KC216]TDB84486.1 conjugal transfer protein TraI [Actinomadura sp. KC216]